MLTGGVPLIQTEWGDGVWTELLAVPLRRSDHFTAAPSGFAHPLGGEGMVGCEGYMYAAPDPAPKQNPVLPSPEELELTAGVDLDGNGVIGLPNQWTLHAAGQLPAGVTLGGKWDTLPADVEPDHAAPPLQSPEEPAQTKMQPEPEPQPQPQPEPTASVAGLERALGLDLDGDGVVGDVVASLAELEVGSGLDLDGDGVIGVGSTTADASQDGGVTGMAAEPKRKPRAVGPAATVGGGERERSSKGQAEQAAERASEAQVVPAEKRTAPETADQKTAVTDTPKAAPVQKRSRGFFACLSARPQPATIRASSPPPGPAGQRGGTPESQAARVAAIQRMSVGNPKYSQVRASEQLCAPRPCRARRLQHARPPPTR